TTIPVIKPITRPATAVVLNLEEPRHGFKGNPQRLGLFPSKTSAPNFYPPKLGNTPVKLLSERL
ncbi:predicted protein, partial [Arabidopsis lyrata subsp. lyrata]